MTIYEQPEDREPVTTSPASVVDTWGDDRFSDIDDPAQETWLRPGVGPALQTVFTGGLVNGDFTAGPPNPDQHIGDENPLPGWSHVVVQGGGITADWMVDATAPGGYALRWTVVNAATDDEVYLEQIVPVAARSGVFVPLFTAGVASPTSILVSFKVAVQALTAAGATTGSEVTEARVFGGVAGIDYTILALPSDARFVRVRFGVVCTFGPASGTATLREVWAGLPRIQYATITGSDVTMPATGTQAVYLVSANATGTPATGASLYPAPALGWVQSISARSNSNIGGADIEYQVYDSTLTAVTGPKATIAVGTAEGYGNGAPDATTNHFGPVDGSVLRFQANVPSGTLTSTALDVVVTAVLAMVVITDL